MENFPSADFDFIALKHVSVKKKEEEKNERERERENVTGTFHVFQFRPHLLPRTSCATRATHVGEKEWRKREKAGLAGREYG